MVFRIPLLQSVRTEPMAKRETLELVRSYYKIKDPKIRRRIFELTKQLGKSFSD